MATIILHIQFRKMQKFEKERENSIAFNILWNAIINGDIQF
jgi:hypothetical protein